MSLCYKSLPFEVKTVDLEEGTFEGYAAIIGIEDDGADVIDAGAFKKTLSENAKRVRILWQHDMKMPIGRPIELREDKSGLWVKAKISETTAGRDALILMKDGVVDELSIGYTSVKEAYASGIRHLKELKLYEISPVTFAMHPQAKITNVKELDFMSLTAFERIIGVKAADFNTIFTTMVQKRALNDQRWRMESALTASVDEIITSQDLDADGKKTALATTLNQFSEMMTAWCSQYVSLPSKDKKSEDEDIETKSTEGTLPQRSRALLQQASVAISALLATSQPEDHKSDPTTDDGTDEPHQDDEAADGLLSELKALDSLFSIN